MAGMIAEIKLGNHGLVELDGTRAKYWSGYGLPDYEGPIDELPEHVLKELLENGFIKRKD